MDIERAGGAAKSDGGVAVPASRDERWIVDLIATHSGALLATARRNSICADDAQDAYQRGLEILMRSAGRLRRDTAVGWLHVVIRNEARAVRAARTAECARTLETDDGRVPPAGGDSPEERVLSLDQAARAAEALRRLKPDERRAMLLQALGLSYQEIAAETGWTRTKVNRCLAEGRAAFLERFAGIDAGDECARWRPVLSAIADGEATARELVDVRPHVRNCAACRATLGELAQARGSLRLLMPAPLLLAVGRGSLLAERAAQVAPGVDPAVAAGGAGALASVATKFAATAAVIGASITLSAPEPRAVRAAEPSVRPAVVAPVLNRRRELPSALRPAQAQTPRAVERPTEQRATAGGVTEADRRSSVIAREFVPPRAPEPSLPPRKPQQDEFMP